MKNDYILTRKIIDLEKRVRALEDINNPADITADDPLMPQAIVLVRQHEYASASLLQRRLVMGYSRAARILDQLETKGLIGPGEGSKPRKVLK